MHLHIRHHNLLRLTPSSGYRYIYIYIYIQGGRIERSDLPKSRVPGDRSVLTYNFLEKNKTSSGCFPTLRRSFSGLPVRNHIYTFQRRSPDVSGGRISVKNSRKRLKPGSDRPFVLTDQCGHPVVVLAVSLDALGGEPFICRAKGSNQIRDLGPDKGPALSYTVFARCYAIPMLGAL